LWANFNNRYTKLFSRKPACEVAICDTFTYFKIWGVLQERVYKTSIKDVDELRRWIAEEWDKLEQRIIDKAVGEWRKRLRASVAAGGGQFEHKM